MCYPYTIRIVFAAKIIVMEWAKDKNNDHATKHHVETVITHTYIKCL